MPEVYRNTTINIQGDFFSISYNQISRYSDQYTDCMIGLNLEVTKLNKDSVFAIYQIGRIES